MLDTWLYVSKSLLTINKQAQIKNIVSVAEAKNKKLGLSGVLLFSDRHFAQYLEGPAETIDRIKSSICADERHKDVMTLQASQCDQRRYGNWSLAYSGRAMYIDSLISRACLDYDGRDLLEMMDAFVLALYH